MEKEEKQTQENEKHEETTNKEDPHEEEKTASNQPEVSAQPKYKQVDPNEIKDAVIPYFDKNLYELYEPNVEELTKHLNESDRTETKDWVPLSYFK